MAMIYFNGKFVPEEQALVSVKTHALQYGTGCFEGIRAYYNEKENALIIFRMLDHYRRMENSTKILMLALPHSAQELCEITTDLIQQNFVKEDIYIRPFAYKSELTVSSFNLATLKNGFAIYTMNMGRYLTTDKGIKANISSWERITDNAIPPRAKVTGSYINTALSKTESALNGFDEAILLDKDGYVVEGSAENIFVVKNGEVFTPDTGSDILIGITRDTVMTLLKNEVNIHCLERRISRTELYTADEIFLVGTGAEISPVIELDHRKIGSGTVGKFTKQIKELYFSIVHGENPKYNQWITKVTK